MSASPLVHQRTLTPIALAVLALCHGSAQAQDIKLLNPVIITATSHEQPIQDVQASAQVIGPRDIQSTTGGTLGEALKQAVGVDTRGSATNSTVSMRGMSSKGTLILYDGLRRTQKYGSSDINLFSVDDAERIEVVRGPMSALYGADASGGVINVITRMPKFGSGLHGSAGVVYGEAREGQRQTDLWKAGVEYGAESSAHRLSVEQRNRKPYDANRSTYAADLPGSDEQYISYHGSLKLAPGHTLKLNLEHVDQDDRGPAAMARTPFTQFISQEKEIRNNLSAGYRGEIGPGVLSVDAARGNTKAKTTRAFPTIEETDYDQTQYLARYAVPLGSHQITVGIGRQEDKLFILNNTSKTGERTNNHALLQTDWKIAPEWNLLAGIRRDNFSDFAGSTTPRVSLQYRPGNWTFRTGYGEAFRAPTVLEQYANFRRGNYTIVGTPELVPEESKSIEAAVGYTTDRFRTELVVYNTKAKNLIETRNTSLGGGQFQSKYLNVSRAEIEGVELSGAWQIDRNWSIQGGFENINARDGATGQRLAGRPGNIVRAGVRFDHGAWSADVNNRYYFNYYNTLNTTGSTTYKSSNYGTTDLKISYRIDKQFTVSGGINNLLDQQAPDNWGAMWANDDPPTRFVYVSAGYRF